jgi:hypothetical protein
MGNREGEREKKIQCDAWRGGNEKPSQAPLSPRHDSLGFRTLDYEARLRRVCWVMEPGSGLMAYCFGWRGKGMSWGERGRKRDKEF